MSKIKRIKVEKPPVILYVFRDAEGCLICDDDFEGMDDGDAVAIYELVKTAVVEKKFDLTDIQDVPREISDVTQPRRRRAKKR